MRAKMIPVWVVMDGSGELVGFYTSDPGTIYEYHHMHVRYVTRRGLNTLKKSIEGKQLLREWVHGCMFKGIDY